MFNSNSFATSAALAEVCALLRAVVLSIIITAACNLTLNYHVLLLCNVVKKKLRISIGCVTMLFCKSFVFGSYVPMMFFTYRFLLFLIIV